MESYISSLFRLGVRIGCCGVDAGGEILLSSLFRQVGGGERMLWVGCFAVPFVPSGGKEEK